MPTFNNLEGLASVRGKINAAIDKVDGVSALTVAPGSAATPGAHFAGDVNTGIYSPAADTLSVSTGGLERVRTHPSGGVSIGSATDPGAGNLGVAGGVASASLSVSGTTTLSGQVGLGGANYGTSGQVLASQGPGVAPAWTTLTFVPTGVIALWSGSIGSIPAGWFLCDGTNGTPDLRDRFVVGAGTTYAVAATGGQNAITSVPAHTHGVGNLANASDGAHTHNGTTSNTGAHQHTHGDGSVNSNASSNNNVYTSSESTSSGVAGTTQLTGSAGAHSHTFTTDSGGAHTHTISGNTASTGAASVDTRPPYYALAYIMKG